MMVKMVEDIISQNRRNDGELLEKDDSVSKILIKNLESIRNLAKKEGISLDKLINVLKKGE